MDKDSLLDLAKRYFISDTGSSLPNLVRKIQLSEGNTPCYATGKSHCEQSRCQWREECLAEKEDGRRADSQPKHLTKEMTR